MNSLLVFIGGLVTGVAIVIVLAIWSAKVGEKNRRDNYPLIKEEKE